MSRRRIKSFSVQQFFKNAAEVWASSPHLRSKSKLHRETKQKSKKQSEESQLPLKFKGCNEIQGFRSNCDFLGKLGMYPSLAEPVSGGFSRSNFQNVSRETLRCNCSTGTVARHLFPVPVSQGGAVLFAPPRKAVAFLTTRSVCQKHGTGISLPAGSDQGYSP